MLSEACAFCQELHYHLSSFGYDVGLAGGILYRGESDKDIDVIIYPLKKLSGNFETMYRSLPDFGLRFVRLPNENLGYPDDGKRVEVWEFQGRRVDLFFLA